MVIRNPKKSPLVLAGFGFVGKALYGLIQERREYLQNRYGIDLRINAVLKSDGGLFFGSGLSNGRGTDIASGPIPASPYWNPGLSVEAVLKTRGPGVFVDCVASNLQTGEPGLAYIRAALGSGWHVATASKGPLLVDLKGLRALAQKNRVSLKYSAATAAALPTLDVAAYSLAGAEIQAIEGILNGTSNYILTRIGEGADYAEALREAQEKGIAEPNPDLDVRGWDTAVKLLLIANSILGLDLTLQDVKIEGIVELSPERLEKARQKGKAVKLIGRMTRRAGRWKAEVSPEIIDPSHPLYGVDGTNKGITYLTDTMGSVTVTGGKSDPRGAAAALLKDIIHILSPPR